MTFLNPLEIKKFLRSSGFEIYRTLGCRVLLAERVRDNLLMDGNVAACTGDRLTLELTTRAQRSDFPVETEEQLFARARGCATAAVGRGYSETGVAAVVIVDPGDSNRTLDTWHDVTFARVLSGLEELAVEATFALGIDKVARR